MQLRDALRGLRLQTYMGVLQKSQQHFKAILVDCHQAQAIFDQIRAVLGLRRAVSAARPRGSARLHRGCSARAEPGAFSALGRQTLQRSSAADCLVRKEGLRAVNEIYPGAFICIKVLEHIPHMPPLILNNVLLVRFPPLLLVLPLSYHHHYQQGSFPAPVVHFAPERVMAVVASGLPLALLVEHETEELCRKMLESFRQRSHGKDGK